jgi:hypothetical protein
MGNLHHKSDYKNIIKEQTKLIKILRNIIKKNINKTHKDVELQTENINKTYKDVELQTENINKTYKDVELQTENINKTHKDIESHNIEETIDIIKSNNTKKDKYINCGKKWTIEDNKKLINMYLQEMDANLMITTFGRTKYALQCQIRRIIYNDYLICKDKIHVRKKYKITIEKLDEIIEKYNYKYRYRKKYSNIMKMI